MMTGSRFAGDARPASARPTGPAVLFGGFQPAVLATPTEIRDAIAAFAGLGADEVMLYCFGLDPAQVDRLADVL